MRKTKRAGKDCDVEVSRSSAGLGGWNVKLTIEKYSYGSWSSTSIERWRPTRKWAAYSGVKMYRKLKRNEDAYREEVPLLNGDRRGGKYDAFALLGTSKEQIDSEPIVKQIKRTEKELVG